MAHSIPDSVAVVVETAAGRVLHTGDWKLDHTPVDGLKTDVGKLAEIGNRGVDLLLGDSTNAERPGMTGSERLVGEAFGGDHPDAARTRARRHVRLEHPPDAAGGWTWRCARVARWPVGRSMRKNLNIARNLGLHRAARGRVVNPQDAMQLPREETLILCTGS